MVEIFPVVFQLTIRIRNKCFSFLNKRVVKKSIYKIINFFGYNIYKKNIKNIDKLEKLEKFEVRTNLDLMYRCAEYIFLLQERYPDLEISDAGEFLKISFNEMIFFVESGEEFIILKEIFIDNEYDFSLEKDCILIDIGANVGMASVFFNQQDNIKKIYSFEPVKDNFQLAEKNFSANNVSKVYLYNFGLGNCEREEQFNYSRQLKGNSGKKERKNFNYRHITKIEERTVKIKKASEVLKSIIEKNRGVKVVIKMDCEGGEYEIIQDLASSNLLSSIDILMLEWHDKGPDTIAYYMKKNNFTFFTRYLGSRAGMIYAVNRK